MERNTNFFSSAQSDVNLPTLTSCARLACLSILICPAVFGQSQGLSITNYQLVSNQTIQRTVNLTYRADLVNTGAALQTVTAVVTSLNPAIQVAAGQDILQFAPVPANSQVTSSDTFTLQVNSNVSVDFSQLQWTFGTGGILVPATVTVAPGDTVNFPVKLGTPAPAGGVFVTLESSNTAVATVFPSIFFLGEGMTSPTRSVPTLSGISAGSATITASAPGYATANGQVLVTPSGSTALTMSFWPGSLTIGATETQNLTLNLSAPVPSALTVSLSSSAVSVAKVPATVSFGANTTSVTVPVTGVAAGSVTITASATNIASAAASVTVTQAATAGILMPSSVAVTAGNTVNFPVSLGTAAPASVDIALATSDPTVAFVFPASLSFRQGETASRTVPTVTGNSAGSATITASAPGYATAKAQVQVAGGAAITMGFSPGSMTINGTVTQDFTLNLSAPAPAGLVVSLSSSNASVATVPAAMTFGTSTTLSVPVTGVAAGSVTITASAAGIAGATATVTVTQAAAGGILLPSGVTVAAGNTVNFPVTLGTAAPSGGVTITLASSNSAVAAVSPSSFTIPAGATSTSSPVQTVSGVSSGSANITASAFGYPTASVPVQVTTAPVAMSFSPATMSIGGTATQNLAMNLSAPASSGLVVSLSSNNPAVATVPASVSFAAGATTVSVPVTGVAAGSATIIASATGIASTTASVTVTQPVTGTLGAIQLSTVSTVGLNQSAVLQLTVSAPAPAGGATVSLTSSDNSAATVTPSVLIAARNTFPATYPLVNGIGPGSATITASAPGFTPASVQVQVSEIQGTSSWQPAWGLTINAGSAQDLTLLLAPTPATPLTVSLSSSNTSVATVPATLTYPAVAGGISVPVTGVAAGSTTITATAPGFGTTTVTVTVSSLNGVSVIWYGACWSSLTLYGITGNFQGIDFQLTTPTPVPVEGTLFFTANCDPSQGTDNMNDTGALTGSTHMIQGFSHHPGVIPSSAMYWIGSATSTGTCPPGSHCSGCVTYNASTPNCSNMP
jgi:hypothetical protein